MESILVLVHGLFFMRASENQLNLELVVPPLTNPHNFLGGVRGQLVTLHQDVFWTNIGLIGKNRANEADVRKSILQFSMSKTQLGGWQRQNFAGTITVPWPLNFFSIRCDFFDRTFLYDKSKTTIVGDNITSTCRGNDPNAKVSFITCLQYNYTSGVAFPGWTPGTNLHCYNEPCVKEEIDAVNQDFADASSIFINGGKFDLRMDKAAGSVSTQRGEQCPNLPNGLDVDDDYSFPEDPLRLVQGICKDIVTKSISPANCPNFFVGS
jgi:hypothetical protein